MKLRIIKSAEPPVVQRIRLLGLPIAIENLAGTTRSKQGSDGKTWHRKMFADYGHFPGTKGKDGDPVDVFVGKNRQSLRVHIVHQTRADGSFDEHKVVLGEETPEDAKKLYLRNYPKGWKVGKVIGLSAERFKAWLREGDKSQPVCKAVVRIVCRKAISAPYLQPAAGWSPRVTTKPEQVKTETSQRTGSKFFLHQPSGMYLRGKPIQQQEISSPMVYHVTPHLNEIGKSGHLRAFGGADNTNADKSGLGGDEGAETISFTKDRHHAVNLHRDMLRMGQFARGDKTPEHLHEIAAEDEKIHRLPAGTLSDAVKWAQMRHASNLKAGTHPLASGVSAYSDYMGSRQTFAKKQGADVRDPKFSRARFPIDEPSHDAHESYQHIHGHNTGIVAVPSRNLPKHAYMQHIPQDMDEIQVHGDVPLRGAKFVHHQENF